MYTGPDLTNRLIGILLRFRRDSHPISADIEQMFYQFYVDEKHRDFLRFFWYKNDFTPYRIPNVRARLWERPFTSRRNLWDEQNRREK